MSQNAPTLQIFTLGCKVNQYESEAIAEHFERAGFTLCHGDTACDLYIINTCTVTAESDRKARQLIRRVHAHAPNAHILVTGCLAQANPAAVADLAGVAHVCGNTEKLSLLETAESLLSGGKPARIRVGDVDNAPFEPMQISRFDRTRAYVKIEDGCENRCTYCAIPGARGRVRSKALDDVVREVRCLTENGCREVVLTGIETASFGRDIGGVDLADLLCAVDEIQGIGRVRLGSLDPSLMKEGFVSRIATLKHLTPHFHISMQSGSSAVLAAMKRKYNSEQAMEGILRLRHAIPDVELTTDFIVGFPGESEEDFAQTMDFARRAEFLSMHVFAYSPRKGTPAATFGGQIPAGVKKKRSAALISLGAELTRARQERALLSPSREVLFETFENGLAIGHTDSFLEVAAPAKAPLHGELRTVQLCGIRDGRLLGEILPHE